MTRLSAIDLAVLEILSYGEPVAFERILFHLPRRWRAPDLRRSLRYLHAQGWVRWNHRRTRYPWAQLTPANWRDRAAS